MMMGTKFMGKPPFPTIYLHAMVEISLAKRCRRLKVMSSTHFISSMDALKKGTKQFQSDYPDGFPAFGADALRFTLAAMSMSGRDIKLSVERVAGYRAFANKIWNAARFVLMRLEGQTPATVETLKSDLEPMDHYILSRLADAASSTDKALEAYRFSDAASSVYQFFWHEFCDWYIELVKSRLFSDDEKVKLLHKAHSFTCSIKRFVCFTHLCRLSLRSFGRNCLSKVRKHLYVFQISLSASTHFRNTALEEDFALLKDAITGIRTVRSESNVPPSKKSRSNVDRVQTQIRARDCKLTLRTLRTFQKRNLSLLQSQALSARVRRASTSSKN